MKYSGIINSRLILNACARAALGFIALSLGGVAEAKPGRCNMRIDTDQQTRRGTAEAIRWKYQFDKYESLCPKGSPCRDTMSSRTIAWNNATNFAKTKVDAWNKLMEEDDKLYEKGANGKPRRQHRADLNRCGGGKEDEKKGIGRNPNSERPAIHKDTEGGVRKMLAGGYFKPDSFQCFCDNDIPARRLAGPGDEWRSGNHGNTFPAYKESLTRMANANGGIPNQAAFDKYVGEAWNYYTHNPDVHGKWTSPIPEYQVSNGKYLVFPTRRR